MHGMVGNRPRYNAIVLSCSIIDKQEIIEKYLLSCDLKSSILPRQGTIRENQFLHRLFLHFAVSSVLVPGQPSTSTRNRVRITTRVRKRLYLDCRNYNRAWL